MLVYQRVFPNKNQVHQKEHSFHISHCFVLRFVNASKRHLHCQERQTLRAKGTKTWAVADDPVAPTQHLWNHRVGKSMKTGVGNCPILGILDITL